MKVTATIQARMGSTRLPGKVMKHIGGKPMLQRQIERIQRSRLVDEIIIATSTSSLDDCIASLGDTIGVKVFRGSEDDVLGRIVELLKQYNVDVHAELIGDSPFSDPQIIDEVIGFFIKNKNKYDYVSNGTKVTYPSGMEVNVYPASVLIDVEKEISKDDPLREHVDIHLSKNPKIKKKCLEAPFFFHNPNIYLEVDTSLDFKMVSEIFNHFDKKGYTHFSLSQILDFLDIRTDLVKMNQNEERKWRIFKTE